MKSNVRQLWANRSNWVINPCWKTQYRLKPQPQSLTNINKVRVNGRPANHLQQVYGFFAIKVQDRAQRVTWRKCYVSQSNRKDSTCIWKTCQYQLQFYSNFWPSDAFYIITMAMTFIYVYFLSFMYQCFTFRWRKHDHHSSWTVLKRKATGSYERSLTIYQFTRDYIADYLHLHQHCKENLTLPSWSQITSNCSFFKHILQS